MEANMSTLNIRLTDQINQQLSHEAQRENRTRSDVARDALAWYLAEIEKRRFMNQLLEEARSSYSQPAICDAAIQMAEESLPLDNEVLAAAEQQLPAKRLRSTRKWWK